MKEILLLISVILSSSCLFSQKGETALMNVGKMYVGEGPGTPRGALYIGKSFVASGKSLIRQEGKTVLKKNFYNNVSSGNVFTTGINAGNGLFEFSGNTTQYILGGANKAVSYINFPDLRIYNQTVVNNESIDTAAVVVAPNIGLSTQDLELYRGRLILDSEALWNGTTDTRKSNVAHLIVNGRVGYDMLLGSYLPGADDKSERGIIQVKLAIGDHFKKGYLIGFTPPFQKIYNDYFFYNFITMPSNKGLFGDLEALISNPKTELISGKGYILGFGIVPENHPYYEEKWDSQWAGTVYNDRFKDMMSFARDYAPYNLARFINEDPAINDQYSGEIINDQDVSVTLHQGWNYVGNPFTSPISMSTFLDEATVADQWGVTRGASVSAEVENKYYILTQGVGQYTPNNHYHPFRFDVSYLVAQKQGNTITLDGNPDSGLIAPMQMFVINKNTPGNRDLKIPASVRSHGNVNYLRSANTVVDELLIETKDKETESYDRLCVVFREDASTVSDDEYDAVKIFNFSEGVNQIYTKSSDGKLMTANVVPPTVKKLVMYFQPAYIEQEITLGAYRLNSLLSVNTVVLEDTKTGNEVDLLETPFYSFRSSPSDKHDRFILHFVPRGLVGTEDMENRNERINIYYEEGRINISGLESDHIGAAVSVFGINGQTICNSTISHVPVTQIQCYLSRGTYLVKIAGENSICTKKLLVK